MARTLPAALATELSATELKPFYAIEMFFDSGTVRFWTGYDEITVNSEDWTGAGTVLGISNSNESTDLSANGLTLTFNGLESSFVAIALTENYRGRTVKVYLGCLDSDNQPVSNLYQLFAGRMDIMSINEDGKVANLTITAENVLIDLERARVRKYTDEEQRKRYPNDASLEFVATLQDKQIVWGR
jgi:hypothetical protein